MSFHLFTSLPPEARQQIWRCAIDDEASILYIRPDWAAAHEVDHLNGEDCSAERDPSNQQDLSNAENRADKADHSQQEDHSHDNNDADKKNGSDEKD